MWARLKDGAEVATDLSLWPEGVTNSREYPVQINRAKILTYNASLGIRPLTTSGANAQQLDRYQQQLDRYQQAIEAQKEMMRQLMDR